MTEKNTLSNSQKTSISSTPEVAQSSQKVLPKNERIALRKCLKLLEISKKRFLLATFFGSGAIGCGVGLGAVSAWLIARAAQLPPVLDLSVAATGVRTFGVGKAIFRYLERISSHWIALNGMSAIRTQVYKRVANSPIEAVTSLRRGDLLARTGSDVDELGEVVVKSLLPAAIAVITSLISIIIVAVISPLIGLILAICLAFAGIIAPYFAMRGARIAQIHQVADRAELNVQALTLLENAEELKISGKIHALEEAQARTEARIWKNRDQAAKHTALAAAIDLFALAISVISAIIIGTWQVSAGTLSVVNLVVVTLTPLSAFEATQRMTNAGVQLIRSAQAATRIIEMLDFNNQDQLNSTNSSISAMPINPDSLSLTASNLTIGWPGGPVIGTGFDLTLHTGKTIAIVGPSGIGKSTLLYTLAGLIKPLSGNVKLADQEVTKISRKDISKILILTAEDAHIFETSVLENLRVASPSLTPEEAVELLTQAGLGKWIAQLPDGVETMLGTDAATISGGERRRILLARALASPADFLLLDEPGEHLDPKTADNLIHDLLIAGKTHTPSSDNALSSRKKERGIILVTHRLNSLAPADEVILLGDTPTRIIARGTHQHLIQTNETYRWSLAQENQN